MTWFNRALLCGLVAANLMGVGFATPAALAQDAKATNLGSFKSWTAWKGNDEYGPICYISAAPDSSEPKEVNGKPIVRSPVHFLVIHRENAVQFNAKDGTLMKNSDGSLIYRKTRNEAQTQIGYKFNTDKDKKPSAAIDGKVYPMGSEGEAAWLLSENDEQGFVAAMKAGTKLTVKGTSLKGTNTTDTYSLGGVTAAMAVIDNACP